MGDVVRATSGRSFPYGLIVILGGLAAMAVGSVGYFRHLDSGLTTLIFGMGAILLIVGAFYSRIEGNFKLGKDGLEMIIAATDRAEKQVKEGSFVDAGDLSSKVRGIQQSLSQGPSTAKATGAEGVSVLPGRREVVIVDDVVMDMAKLGDTEMRKVESQIDDLRNPGLTAPPDPRATGVLEGYSVRQVPGTNLTIWYRPVDASRPGDTWMVAFLQRKG